MKHDKYRLTPSWYLPNIRARRPPSMFYILLTRGLSIHRKRRLRIQKQKTERPFDIRLHVERSFGKTTIESKEVIYEN